MTSPSVAVCIPTYNQAKYLEEAVLSACRQDYENMQVWVADDASTDNTPDVMMALCKQFPQVFYHRQTSNKGIAENSSWLLCQPDTDFLVRLDSDDLLAPSYIATLITQLEKYPDAGYAHSAIQIINGDGQPLIVRNLARRSGYQDSELALRACVSGYRTAGNIIMFRSEALKRLHFYEGRPEFVEDYDLAVRMADAGYGNVYIETVLASYRIWVDEEMKRAKRKQLQINGYIRIFEESLEPAFRRRGWNTRALKIQRQRLARGHATYCFSPIFTPDERKSLVFALMRLGNSPLLRLQILALRLGLGFMFSASNMVKSKTRLLIRAIIFRGRFLSARG